MKIKIILLCTATLSLGGCAMYADNSGSGPRYTPRPAVAPQNYTHTNHVEDHKDARSYEDYEQREPCQRYRRIPRDYIESCANTDVVDMNEDMVVVTTENTVTDNRLLPIINSYTILFDFDKSTIRPDENETLNRIMNEINKYDPRQVTVTGYTDSSGQVDYNQKLSRDREQAVSRALMQRGIENQTLERDARGEYDQAVQTPDDTRNQQNRRVVVDFRR